MADTGIFEKMRQCRFDTDNGSVVYWADNCQSETTLVFLHGLTADHRLFEGQAEYFRGRFGLIFWDAPAHGMSRPYKDFPIPVRQII
ncbi:MAG: alpha/beta hydrolase [Ruminococcus sp.]|nr:alpha/beta hydrolase [Ruminococcus sp.]